MRFTVKDTSNRKINRILVEIVKTKLVLYILSFFLGAFNLLSFSPYNFKLAIIISFLYFYVIERSLKNLFINLALYFISALIGL